MWWWTHVLYCTLLVPCMAPGPQYDWVQYQQNIFMLLVPFMVIATIWAFGGFDSKDEE